MQSLPRRYFPPSVAAKRTPAPATTPKPRILPGIVAGAADLDPAAVLTATVAGSTFGYSLGWVVLLCVPVLFSVLKVSSRIGLQTGSGLVQLIREHYGRKAVIPIAFGMVAVNLAMIVGDIVAVSDALALIMNLPRVFYLAAVGFTVWYLLIIGNYQTTTKALGILTLVLIAYVLAAIHVTDSFTGLWSSPTCSTTRMDALALMRALTR